MLEFCRMVTLWYSQIDRLSTPALLRLFKGGSRLAKLFGLSGSGAGQEGHGEPAEASTAELDGAVRWRRPGYDRRSARRAFCMIGTRSASGTFHTASTRTTATPAGSAGISKRESTVFKLASYLDQVQTVGMGLSLVDEQRSAKVAPAAAGAIEVTRNVPGASCCRARTTNQKGVFVIRRRSTSAMITAIVPP